MKSHVDLRMTGGVAICAPASLRCVTTYVVLEQEQWFEKEVDFVRRFIQPGMTAIDVGANHGGYALPMARQAGAEGQVIAYEPAGETAALLQASRDENGFSQLHIERRALSNTEGQARLFLSAEASEWNSLQPPKRGAGSESVPLATLDREWARLGFAPPDFVKIDAEGEEARIVEGGRALFSRASPLVMIEVAQGSARDLSAVGALEALGYGIFRLLGDSSMLAPWSRDMTLDWELNLFAAKPDRVADLMARGLLARDTPFSAHAASSLFWLSGLPYLQAFGVAPAVGTSAYGQGLSAYGLWRDTRVSPTERYGALMAALQMFLAAVSEQETPARLSTLARAAWEMGDRTLAIRCLDTLSNKGRPHDETFLPVSPRFDELAADGRPDEWFFVSVMEQAERLGRHSTVFKASDSVGLAAICGSDLASPEMTRRMSLQLASVGAPPSEAFYPRLDAGAHLNAEFLTPEQLGHLALS